MKQLIFILRLARLHFLLPGFMLYLLGYQLALLNGVENDLTKFVFGYLIFGTAHLSISFSNDYFDRHSDRNSAKTAFSGGSKILIEHPELQSLALKFALFLLFTSILANIFFTVVYDYTILFFVFGLIGALLGWFYTAPPLKLAYRGLGELTAILAIGFLMPGMGYLIASGTISSPLNWIFLPLSCYGLFFIITVEMPDVESDALGQKKSLLVKYGRKSGKLVSVAATLTGTISMILLLLFKITNLVDWPPFAAFSFLPLVAAISSLFMRQNTRKFLVKQVTFNIASMILFLFLIDFSLFFQHV